MQDGVKQHSEVSTQHSEKKRMFHALGQLAPSGGGSVSGGLAPVGGSRPSGGLAPSGGSTSGSLAPLYSAPSYSSYPITFSTVQSPGAPGYAPVTPAVSVGPYGDGTFTPIDYPAMRFRGSTQNSEFSAQQKNTLCYLAVGLAVLALLKK